MIGDISNGTTPPASSTVTVETVLAPRLIEGAQAVRLPDGRLRMVRPEGGVTLPILPPPVSDVLARLGNNTVPLAQIIDQIARLDGPGLISQLFVHLTRLTTQGFLTYRVVVDGEEYASIEPTGMRHRFLIQPIPDTQPLRLSRFSVMRREDDHMVVESGLGHALVRIRHGALVGLPGILTTPQTPATLRAVGEAMGIRAEATAGLLVLLQNGKHLEGTGENEREDLSLWNPHDLLFHASSRYGRIGGFFGGTFRHIGDIDPAPALRQLPSGIRVPLPVPVLEDMVRNDPPFQEVVETRRSIYSYGSTPITRDEIGEFLYRVARVRHIGNQSVTSVVTGRQGEMEISSRPTPAGGRGYELELYLTVDSCAGLERGMYHYDPAGHQLTLVRPADDVTEQMLTFASIASPGIRPQILITMAARFRRMMWKYDRIAYAATLKHVGVMMQQMYLAATTMHLAPSAQGSGNIELFALATGNDPEVEGSVGEFILGSSTREPRRHRPTMIYSGPAS